MIVVARAAPGKQISAIVSRGIVDTMEVKRSRKDAAVGATHASHGQGCKAAPWAAGERALRAQPGEPQQTSIGQPGSWTDRVHLTFRLGLLTALALCGL